MSKPGQTGARPTDDDRRGCRHVLCLYHDLRQHERYCETEANPYPEHDLKSDPSAFAGLLVKQHEQARPDSRDRRPQDQKWVVDAGGPNHASSDDLRDGQAQNNRDQTDAGRNG